MSIAIIRAFVRLCQMIESNKDIAFRVGKPERGHERAASVIEVLVEDIDELSRQVKDLKGAPARDQTPSALSRIDPPPLARNDPGILN